MRAKQASMNTACQVVDVSAISTLGARSAVSVVSCCFQWWCTEVYEHTRAHHWLQFVGTDSREEVLQGKCASPISLQDVSKYGRRNKGKLMKKGELWTKRQENAHR